MTDVIAYHNARFLGTGGKLLRVRQFTPVKYGLLYNWFAVTDARSIAPTGWHYPTISELQTLQATLGGQAVAGGHMKEVGLTWWTDPNTGADNSSGFNARGGMYRTATGSFYNLLGRWFIFWSSDYTGSFAYSGSLTYDNAAFNTYNVPNGIANKKCGVWVRLIKNDSVNTGTMTDFDGNVYPTVKIGDQVWMAANLIVEHYNNGDTIPEVTDGTTWGGLTTGALCAPDNNWNNV